MSRKPIVPNDLNSGKRFDQLVEQHLAIEAEDAVSAGALGFNARILAQATLPHQDPGDAPFFGRQNGNIAVAIQPGTQPGPNGIPVSVGIPYGNIPRLLLIWVATEAVRTRERELVLGPTLSDFMRQLELVPTGGRWGSVTRLREQMKRLFASRITVSRIDTTEDGREDWIHSPYNVGKARLWWDPKHPDQAALWESTLQLDQAFFEELIDRPIPIDMRAIKALRASPLELDIYTWLTHRASYLRAPTRPIPWEVLAKQFGSEYAETRNFKTNFIKRLKNVLVVYHHARVEEDENGLVLLPGKTHVKVIPKNIIDTNENHTE